ncbi:MAG: CAP domain-containing protein [Bacteroidetes bacterium]|nr:CAP domain-containing protein [Bacteroidota bacterium]
MLLYLLLCLLVGSNNTLTDKEISLATSINEYRISKGLQPLKISKSLTSVARIHAADLQLNGSKIKKNCNLHSWSKSSKWKQVDYYEDHRNAQGMWDKPAELTNYKSNGYEIAYFNSDSTFTIKHVLDTWKNSPGHNSVLINSGPWKNFSFDCMGIVCSANYALVWFGTEIDLDGYIEIKN